MIDIVICGVGGQGIISIGHLLGQICLNHELNFISSETHGMSQRGGSVIFHFRIGDKHSPLIPMGNADILIATEPVEGLRNIEYLKPNGTILVNDSPIQSPIARQLGIDYPDLKLIFRRMSNWPSELFVIKTSDISKKMRISKSQNIAFLGALIALNKFPVDKNDMKALIAQKWPKFEKPNLNAFDIGYQAISSELRRHAIEEVLVN